MPPDPVAPCYLAELRWRGPCPPGQQVTCKGSWDGWRSEVVLQRDQHGDYVALELLPTGRHQYKIEAGRGHYVVCQDRPYAVEGSYINNVLIVRPPIVIVYGNGASDRAFILLNALRFRGLYAVPVAASSAAEHPTMQHATAVVLIHAAGADAEEVGVLARAWKQLVARRIEAIVVSDGEQSALREALTMRGTGPELPLLPWPVDPNAISTSIDAVVETVLHLPSVPPGPGSPATVPNRTSSPQRAPARVTNRRGQSPARPRLPPGNAFSGGARAPTAVPTTAVPASAVAVRFAAAPLAAPPPAGVPAKAKPCVPVVPVLATESALAAEGGVAQQAVRLMESLAGGRFSFELRPLKAGAPDGGAGAGRGAAVVLGTAQGSRLSDTLVESVRAIRRGSDIEVVLVVLRNCFDAARVDDYPTAVDHGSGILNVKAPRRAVLRLVHYEGRLREDDARGVDNLRTLMELLSMAISG
eukprot:tig00021036_g17304.t1